MCYSDFASAYALHNLTEHTNIWEISNKAKYFSWYNETKSLLYDCMALCLTLNKLFQGHSKLVYFTRALISMKCWLCIKWHQTINCDNGFLKFKENILRLNHIFRSKINRLFTTPKSFFQVVFMLKLNINFTKTETSTGGEIAKSLCLIFSPIK